MGTKKLIIKYLFSKKEILVMEPGEDTYWIRGTNIKITGLEIESLNKENEELFLKDLRELLFSKQLTVFLNNQIIIDKITGGI